MIFEAFNQMFIWRDTKEEHNCFFCGLVEFDHTTKNCLKRCPCGGFHTKENHKCWVCDLVGYDHKSEDCFI